MAATAIEWADSVWNPIIGCTRVSRGCERCYAERQAFRNAALGISRYDRLTKKVGGEIRWTGEVRLVPEVLDAPLRWRTPRRIFVNSMSDLFHERVRDEWIALIWGVMMLAEQHTFQVLTKRAEQMRSWLTRMEPARCVRFALDHVGDRKGYATVGSKHIWLGVSVEDQATADARVPLLLQTPAAVRWVSYEPALGSVDFGQWLVGEEENGVAPGRPVGTCVGWTPPLDWLVVGGESGPGARPFDLAWARVVITQCRAAGVPVFLKQFGSQFVTSYYDDQYRALYEKRGEDWPDPIDWDIRDGQPPLSSRVRIKLRDRKGGDPAEWPEDLRVRQWPQVLSGD